MGNPIPTTKLFAENFAKVAAYYACSDAEIIEMKQTARNDIENAVISFGLMAKEIEDRK